MGYNFSRYTRAIVPGSRIVAHDEPLTDDMLRAAVPSSAMAGSGLRSARRRGSAMT